MKKLIALMLVLCLLLAGCGNVGIFGFGNYEYHKIHVDTHHYNGCLTVEKWYESGSGVEVETAEAGSIFFSEGTYIMLEGGDPCPFCGED